MVGRSMQEKNAENDSFNIEHSMEQRGDGYYCWSFKDNFNIKKSSKHLVTKSFSSDISAHKFSGADVMKIDQFEN